MLYCKTKNKQKKTIIHLFIRLIFMDGRRQGLYLVLSLYRNDPPSSRNAIYIWNKIVKYLADGKVVYPLSLLSPTTQCPWPGLVPSESTPYNTLPTAVPTHHSKQEYLNKAGL